MIEIAEMTWIGFEFDLLTFGCWFVFQKRKPKVEKHDTFHVDEDTISSKFE